MTVPATVAHWLLVFAAAGAVSFFFVGLPSYLERRADRPLWVRGVHDAGLLLALVQLGGVFLLAPRSESAAAAGIILYTVSVAIFLSAMEAASGTRLQRSFIDHPVPDRLITHGPYRWVRHPFYMGYMIGALAPVVAIASVWIAAISVATTAIVVVAALREERVWLASPRADAYREYQQRTAMFFPGVRLSRRR